MLDADEEQLRLFLEEEFRELTMEEADILLQLTDVRAAKQRVRRLVAETKNRHAPIFALPDELLVSIVQAAQQATDHSARVEVLVSHVSQRFRWAVVGASSLWSSIELYWGVESDEDRFAAYLARSRTYILSVTAKYDAFYGKEECEYDEVPSQLATVALHISRIHRLTLHYDGTGLNGQDALMHFHSLHAPCLEYLEISSHALQSHHAPSLSIFNGGAPRLTSLKIENVDPVASSGNPWMSGLTRLDFRGTLGGMSSGLRASCSQLIDLTLDDSTFFIVHRFMPGPVSSMPFLRSLRVLCLNYRPDALTSGALSIIDTPALEVLQFSGAHINRSQISSFFNRLSPSKVLKSLTFANSGVANVCRNCEQNPPAHIQPRALRSFLALESLTIINICHANALLGDLLATWNAADAAPRCGLSSLRTLTLRYKDADQFGIAAWPKPELQPASLDSAQTVGTSPDDLRKLLARPREIQPLYLRLPRSRFFTGRDDWDPDDLNFEIFDVDPLLRSLGYDEDTEHSISW